MKREILVVDNDRMMLKFMDDLLSRKGYQVVTAEDGLMALDVLKHYTPDIIFVDLIMPNIEGKKLCQLIRANPKLKDVKVVILSAIAAEEDINLDEINAIPFPQCHPQNQCVLQKSADRHRHSVSP